MPDAGMTDKRRSHLEARFSQITGEKHLECTCAHSAAKPSSLWPGFHHLAFAMDAARLKFAASLRETSERRASAREAGGKEIQPKTPESAG
jgi:hypothetical protein